MTLLIAYIYNILDFLFTLAWVKLYGIDIESNPIGYWMFQNNVTWFFKLVVVGIIFAILGYCIKLRPKLAWVIYIPFIVYFLLVIYHLSIFFLINAI